MNTEIFSAGTTPALHAVVGLVADGDPAASAAAWETLGHAETELARFGLAAERWPAPRSPEDHAEARARAREAADRGLRALIVASPDAALPAALAGATTLPVIRVPIATVAGGTGEVGNEAATLAVLWPEPSAAVTATSSEFATVAIGEAGARNAALLVASILALGDERLRDAWRKFRRAQTNAVLGAILPEA